MESSHLQVLRGNAGLKANEDYSNHKSSQDRVQLVEASEWDAELPPRAEVYPSPGRKQPTCMAETDLDGDEMTALNALTSVCNDSHATLHPVSAQIGMARAAASATQQKRLHVGALLACAGLVSNRYVFLIGMPH